MTSNRTTGLIRIIQHSRLQRARLLARGRRVTRRDIERRVPQEEIPRSEEHRHGLRRHDRIVLGRGEMRDAERMPEDDVRVLNVFVGVLGDPFGQALGGLAGRLGHVAARGVELVVLV